MGRNTVRHIDKHTDRKERKKEEEKNNNNSSRYFNTKKMKKTQKTAKLKTNRK